jgi:hypothetical protein
MKQGVTIFVLLLVLLSCKKNSSPNITLSTNLTNCPANSNCTYNYYDDADFGNAMPPVHGSFRVFSYQSGTLDGCGAISQFLFKTALNAVEFDINSNQIAAGQIVVGDQNSCPCCATAIAIFVKPIGGEIKGKRTDATHWLVNASIIFGSTITSPIDTIVVNQYFTQQKLQ